MSDNNVKMGFGFTPQWKGVFKRTPIYFFDEESGTLGFDGCWKGAMYHKGSFDFNMNCVIDLSGSYCISMIKQVYLGKNFLGEALLFSDLCSDYPVTVEEGNPYMELRQGIVVDKRSGEPLLNLCGGGEYYVVKRDGKCGAVDKELNLVIPCLYDRLDWRYCGGMVIVKKDGLYGLVDNKGSEVLPIAYDDIEWLDDGKVELTEQGKTRVVELASDSSRSKSD